MAKARHPSNGFQLKAYWAQDMAEAHTSSAMASLKSTFFLKLKVKPFLTATIDGNQETLDH